MLQKELAKRLKARCDTKMDGSGWLEVSSDGIPICRIKYNGQYLSNADQNLSDEYRSKIADIQEEISTKGDAHMDEDRKKQIGLCVKHIRKMRNMTQEQLAESADLSVTFISNIENGKISISAETVIRLSVALKVSSDRLLNIEPEKDEKQISCFIKECTADETELLLEIIELIIKLKNKYQET